MRTLKSAFFFMPLRTHGQKYAEDPQPPELSLSGSFEISH